MPVLLDLAFPLRKLGNDLAVGINSTADAVGKLQIAQKAHAR
jgi:hypothetical protein